MFKRSQTRRLKVGNVIVGGGAPVSVQTMAKAPAHDAGAILRQLESAAAAGADIFRMAVPDMAAAKVFGEVRSQSPLPIVADIHFDYRLALAAVDEGADALRFNPGNIGSRERVGELARAAKARGIPIRVGVNGGSLEKGESLVSSALKHVRMLEDEGFFDIAVSVKASDPVRTVEAYRELARKTDCPLHLGVTEAGTLLPGTVRSSVALGILLAEGIGDTVRVSLSDTPEREVKVGLEILRSLALRPPGPAVVSCPACARAKVDVAAVAAEVESRLEILRSRKNVRVAVMGCAVNGPGEAKDADVALCGGDGEFLLYVKGECRGKVPAAEAVERVIENVLAYE